MKAGYSAKVRNLGARLLWLLLFMPVLAGAQIDPERRDLVQFGYNQALEGHTPFTGYAYYYHNQPDFLRTNLTLRLAVAPVYMDSELGFIHGLGPNTDFAIGLAGGGFADSYYEIHDGTYYSGESFEGSGGEVSASIYHLFNPGDLIPLNLILRGAAHYAVYGRDSGTASGFQLPPDHGEFSVRTGLRWGGVEPVLLPALAMELSGWYEGRFRTDSAAYGFGGDREMKSQSQLFWLNAALDYTLPESKQNFSVRLTAGTSVDTDRLSAFRLGGFLPLGSEFPLSMPGYYYQEISARQFALFYASYLLPLDDKQRWNIGMNFSSAVVDYLPGEGQPGNWLNGVGVGVLYRSPANRWNVLVGYGYGINAVRTDGRGADNVGILVQLNLGKTRPKGFSPSQPDHWRGWQWLLGM